VLLIVILAFLGYLVYLGLEWYQSQPKIVEDLTHPGVSFERYELGPDQQGLVQEWGYPDSFRVLFFQEDANGSLQTFRLETWDYFNRSTRSTFLNGRLISEEAVDFEVGRVVENPYTPEQFDAFMTLDQVLSSTSIDKYIVAPTEGELVENGSTYFADRIMFGLVNGELVYAETVIPELE